MFHTKGIEAIATITELRSKTSTLIDRAKEYQGIMIQKNNEPYAVLLSYDKYLELIGEKKKK
jgi:prevent-host-death family protein